MTLGPILHDSHEPSVYNYMDTYMDTEIKTLPNYPPQPPMPASYHPK